MSIYDRQLDTDLFKRLHATKFNLKPKSPKRNLGPGSYNPRTIDEIYREKTCNKYGTYFQQSKRFPSMNSKFLYPMHGLGNIRDESRRCYNAIRLDRQSYDDCQKRREVAARAPPVTLYEKRNFLDELLRIYGPYFKSAQDRPSKIPDWYKGPARLQDKSPSTILDLIFSKSNRYKGKFLPMPSNFNRNANQKKSTPGPTTYFNDLITPVSYNPDPCSRLCYTKRNK